MTSRLHLSAAILFFFGISAQNSLASPQKSGSINLGLNLSKSWNQSNSDYEHSSTYASTASNLSFSGTYLILGEHFHFGPSLSYGRYYVQNYQSTTEGIGGVAKFTLENIQEATGTPFLSLRAGLARSKRSFYESSTKALAASLGYEFFLNSYVSFQNYIQWEKQWSNGKENYTSAFGELKMKNTNRRENLSFNIGVGIYL